MRRASGKSIYSLLLGHGKGVGASPQPLSHVLTKVNESIPSLLWAADLYDIRLITHNMGNQSDLILIPVLQDSVRPFYALGILLRLVEFSGPFHFGDRLLSPLSTVQG